MGEDVIRGHGSLGDHEASQLHDRHRHRARSVTFPGVSQDNFAAQTASLTTLQWPCTKTELVEAIVHLAFYAGWPRAMSALTVAKTVVAG
jgi:Carboxymuconolactone decarboxylase family